MSAAAPAVASTNWAADYIGQPWIARENDCWAFVRRVWAERFGLQVPAVDVDPLRIMSVAHAFAGHPERAAWIEITQPVEGDAVLMAHGRRPLHVGIWISADGGGVLHCDHDAGVMFSRPRHLSAAGWLRLSYYRHRSCA